MQDLYAESLARTSFTLVMLAIAGAMALALGVVGIYGVIAYVVSQRTREIGIRSALGAEPRQLATMFLRHGLTLSAVGVVVGLVAAAALGRAMSSLLFGIEPLDPVAYVTAIGVILAAAALATYLPARRAATIDPDGDPQGRVTPARPRELIRPRCTIVVQNPPRGGFQLFAVRAALRRTASRALLRNEVIHDGKRVEPREAGIRPVAARDDERGGGANRVLVAQRDGALHADVDLA